MGKYAENTSVSVDKSRAEIEKTLSRYGANKFMYGWDEGRAMIAFTVNKRNIKFIVPLPFPEDYKTTPTGRTRKDNQVNEAFEQATRQKWRALSLAVKAKLEAVESGIATFEQEFLAYMVLPGGRTVAEAIVPQIEQSYESGKDIKLIEL